MCYIKCNFLIFLLRTAAFCFSVCSVCRCIFRKCNVAVEYIEKFLQFMALWKMMCILVGFGTDQCCTEPRMFQILMLSCQQVPVGGEMRGLRTRTGDLDWPKGYPVLYGTVLSNKNGGKEEENRSNTFIFLRNHCVWSACCLPGRGWTSACV